MTPSPIELRVARPSDIEVIFALERATQNAPHWPLAAYSAILDDRGSCRCLMVAHFGEALAGFAVGLLHPEVSGSSDRVAELESVAVAADYRRAGIGRALCVAVFDWCRSRGASEVVLEVRASSSGAIALYYRLGFSETGYRPRYYRDPEEDALLMRSRLDSGGSAKTGPSR